VQPGSEPRHACAGSEAPFEKVDRATAVRLCQKDYLFLQAVTVALLHESDSGQVRPPVRAELLIVYLYCVILPVFPS
jgi:hypothetical protein